MPPQVAFAQPTPRFDPQRIHITMSAPAAFAALLGHHLTALNADILTYELDDDRYTNSLTLTGQRR